MKNRIPVRTNPDITVPQRESRGFFIEKLLSDRENHPASHSRLSGGRLADIWQIFGMTSDFRYFQSLQGYCNGISAVPQGAAPPEKRACIPFFAQDTKKKACAWTDVKTVLAFSVPVRIQWIQFGA